MEFPIRQLTILGSTGSIGENALRVVSEHPDRLRVLGLSAFVNAERLIRQAQEFHPAYVWIGDTSAYKQVEQALHSTDIRVLTGRDGLLEAASDNRADLVLNAIVGSAGMEPTLAAIRQGIDVALSNKESLVMAGAVINQALSEHEVNLYPVDSEHSAIWQCLQGEQLTQVQRLLLTASGGPFRETPLEQFQEITVEEALDHPNWSMGRKITIDSATMMNKGLEVIEAHWLFHIPPADIEVVIHPQSIIHSLVEFHDGSVKAQLGVPDMKGPIQYALLYPDHVAPQWERLDLIEMGALTFEAPDMEKFPALRLAYGALEQGGSLPAVMNVANELAVQAFLDGEISFPAITDTVESVMEAHRIIREPNLEDIRETERWTKGIFETKLVT